MTESASSEFLTLFCCANLSAAQSPLSTARAQSQQYAVRNCHFWLRALMNGKDRVGAVLGNSSAYGAQLLLQNTNSLICIYFN